jgi:hypothetical protein
MTYLDELSHELAAHGIRGRTRRRILLGRTTIFARTRTHRGASALHARSPTRSPLSSARSLAPCRVSAFAALGVAGAVYAVSFVSLGFASPPAEMLDPRSARSHSR